MTLTRRRGEELEQALLAAAWEELLESGYAAFTIDAVAARAGTSRPVVYRRWPTKPELVLAAIAAAWERNPIEAPDTGTLRGDTIALLRRVTGARAEFAAVLSTHLGAFYQESGLTMVTLRERLLGSRARAHEVLMERAIARGEVDPARVTPRIADLPYDLMRHELLTTLRPVSDETIEEIVDTIYLPLVLRTAP